MPTSSPQVARHSCCTWRLCTSSGSRSATAQDSEHHLLRAALEGLAGAPFCPAFAAATSVGGATLTRTDATSNDAFDEALNSLAIFKKEPLLIEAEEVVEEVRVEEEKTLTTKDTKETTERAGRKDKT